MPTKSRRFAAAVIAVVLALPATRLQAATCKTTEGTFTSNTIPPPTCTSPVGICTTGALNGKFPESYDFVMDSAVPMPTGQLAYTGHSLITRTNGGATLIGQDTGVMTFTGPDTATFVTTVNVVGGTKQFQDATGTYVATGELNFVTGVATGTFTSTVCK